ncbi:hypothetical protein PUY80_08410 [Plantibacter flavus]|uniref:hypothetical protein n=1 Tax=Plantibacter flavus TaxID=150123 RepID=UPI00237886A0|nr:hypothetical protein [Plantibacter flavus]MDD9152596.1 hypothetical protein [Plantibacter flavus]
MTRLLDGHPRITDGALTKKNLYLEAEVSRATMNRARDLLLEWDAAVAETLGRGTKAKKPFSEEQHLKRQLKEAKAEITALRSRLAGAASLIALLTEDNRYLTDRINAAPTARLADIDEYRSKGQE